MTKEEFMKIVKEEGLKGPCAEDFWRLFDKSISLEVARQAQMLVKQDHRSVGLLRIEMETISDPYEEARLRREESVDKKEQGVPTDEYFDGEI